jgi:hypothetical protein
MKRSGAWINSKKGAALKPKSLGLQNREYISWSALCHENKRILRKAGSHRLRTYGQQILSIAREKADGLLGDMH